MNIQDIKRRTDIPPDDMIMKEILTLQGELLEKYREIEGIPTHPVPFQNKESQIWFKRFLWRIHEELCEAEEAIKLSTESGEPQLTFQHVTHFFEEMSDALHFFVDLMLLADVSVKEVNEDYDILSSVISAPVDDYIEEIGDIFFSTPNTFLFREDGSIKSSEEINPDDRFGLTSRVLVVTDLCRDVSYQLGLIGNVLKFKAWKQTAVMSDKVLFEIRTKTALKNMLHILISCGLKASDVYLLYTAKHEVNKWRQRTKY